MTDQPTSIKEINQVRILNLLRLHPGISRADVVNRTGLGKATVSSLVSELIEDGLVMEAGVGVQLSGAGRRPVKLRLRSQTHLAIGVELTGSECVAILADLYGRPLRVLRHPMPEPSVDTSLGTIEQAASELLDGYDQTRVLGIGVGVPGPVDAMRQRVLQAENIDWYDVPLGPLLEDRVGMPVTVVKRQHAGALGEYWYGIGKGCRNLLYISIGVGIGCGIIIDGELYDGSSGTAGEIGHITIVADGQRCRCGNYGCLETVASCQAMAVRARQEVKKGRKTVLFNWETDSVESIGSEQVIKAAASGDALAVEIVEEAARYLAIAISTVINLFNPAKIILGGAVVELGDLFLRPVREAVRHRAFVLSLPGLEVVPSSLGDQAAAIGVATLVIDRFFTLAGHDERLK